MRAARVRGRLGAYAFATFSALAVPGAGRAEAPSAAPPADARARLARMHAAAEERNYAGTLVFSAGGHLSSARVAHFRVGARVYERFESLDGRDERVFRVDEAVHTFWPGARVAVIEKLRPASPLPSATHAVEPRALDQYTLKDEGRGRIAGREAQVFLLEPRDTMRYAQRLWADAETGLMLRADVIGPDRQVLESSAFSAVELGIRPQADSVMGAVKRLEGYRVLRPVQQAAGLGDEGWALVPPAPGFTLSDTQKRALAAPDAPADAAASMVLQAVYSDGLTQVSLFIEPQDAKRPEGTLAPMGATATLRRRVGEHLVTVMGDVPPATLEAFARALQRTR